MSSFTSVAAPEEIESSRDDRSAAQRVLREAVERQQVGPQGLQAARFQLLNLFARIERLGAQIDEAFGGQPFLPDVPPDDRQNRRGSTTNWGDLRKVPTCHGQ